MNWKLKLVDDSVVITGADDHLNCTKFEPYEDSIQGRAQFAAIILKYQDDLPRHAKGLSQGEILDYIASSAFE